MGIVFWVESGLGSRGVALSGSGLWFRDINRA